MNHIFPFNYTSYFIMCVGADTLYFCLGPLNRKCGTASPVTHRGNTVELTQLGVQALRV